MKITKIETHLADQFTFVKILTDEEIYGIGEVHPASGTTGTAFTIRGAINHCAEYLIGKNPLEIEKNWQHMFRRTIFRGGSDLMAAIGGLDIALWDIAGKASNLPIHKLLGGPTRDRVRVYTHINGNNTDELTEDAKEKINQGYTALRFYPFGDFNEPLPNSITRIVKTAVNRVEAVKKVSSDEIDLMIDSVNRLSPPEAVAVGKSLEQYNLFFFEDPIESDNIDALSKVANSITVPIATGERLYTIYQFLQLLNKNAASYIRPDLSLAGGITNCKKIASIAEANYIGVVPHNPLSPVLTAACVQFCAATHNISIQEYFTNEQLSPKSDLVDSPLSIKQGHLIIPDRVGLGIDLNLEAFKHYPPIKRARNPLKTSDGALRDY
jgi:galactonate dehydratase